MPLLLADKGTALMPIWTPVDAPEQTHLAAQEIAAYLHKITGACFHIHASQTPPPHCIAVDYNTDPALGEEGFHIQSDAHHVCITGGHPRGVLYGAYTFLEHLGCLFLTSKATHIPQRPTLLVPDLDVREIPKLEYRETFYVDAMDANWSVRQKNNGNHMHLDAARGGKIAYYPFVHTFESLLSAADHFDDHPEYFSMVDGVRIRDKAQLCLTNPDVIDLCTQKVESWIQSHPDTRIFSVSQNDWYNPCQCPACKAIDDAEGSHAGSLIAFVNAIAERIEKNHPQIVIDTLAYQYTRPAPKSLRPRPNVCVRLCSIECCFAHPLRDCEKICSFADRIHGDSFQKDLRDWAKVCDRLYVWDYVVNFSHYVMPFPNFHVLRDNIQYLIENNVKGIFEEGATTIYGGAEFAELRAYVLAKLMWNPDLDTNTLVSEFISAYYRAAAAPILDYFHYIHDRVQENPDIHFGIYDPPRITYLTPEVTARCKALFDRAVALADDEEILRRVRVAQLPIRYWEILSMPVDDDRREDMTADLFADLAELGVNEIWEGHTMPEARERLKEGLVWRFPVA